MANIQPYLDAIMSAIYGEEVRGSIHDAIDEINTYVEAAVSAELTAPKLVLGSEMAETYNNNLAKIDGNYTFHATGAQGWTDLPQDGGGNKRRGIIQTLEYINPGEYMQTLTATDGTSDRYVRFTNSDTGEAYPWVFIGNDPLVTDGTRVSRDTIYGWSSGWLYRVVWKDYIFRLDSSDNWKDLPTDFTGNGIFESRIYSETHARQTITSTDGNGYVWTREIELNTENGSPWVGGPNNKRAYKIMVVGDSVALGVRNGNKGFAGDLVARVDSHEAMTTRFRNLAQGGAALSKRAATTANPKLFIADQLVTQSDGWEPDVIIAGTGTNDYAKSYELGTVPTRPLTAAEYQALVQNSTTMTALQGLECLLYKMATMYPRAKRVFVTEHRVLDKPWTNNTASSPYNQTDITNAILATCHVYGCMVADVFNESSLNTYFSQYRSNTSWSSNHAITNTAYCDSDGDHPTALGYWEFYVPLVRQCVEACPVAGDYVPISV